MNRREIKAAEAAEYDRYRLVEMLSLKTTSFKQTKALAKLLSGEIFHGKNGALVFALSGDLGTGKTTFSKGFIAGAGVKRKITSPTFVLVKSYKIKSYKIYHIDCYRIKKPKELFDSGLEEILKNPKNIVLIEWPEIIKKYLPKGAIWIEFKHGEKINERIIKLK